MFLRKLKQIEQQNHIIDLNQRSSENNPRDPKDLENQQEKPISPSIRKDSNTEKDTQRKTNVDKFFDLNVDNNKEKFPQDNSKFDYSKQNRGEDYHGFTEKKFPDNHKLGDETFNYPNKISSQRFYENQNNDQKINDFHYKNNFYYDKPGFDKHQENKYFKRGGGKEPYQTSRSYYKKDDIFDSLINSNNNNDNNKFNNNNYDNYNNRNNQNRPPFNSNRNNFNSQNDSDIPHQNENINDKPPDSTTNNNRFQFTQEKPEMNNNNNNNNVNYYYHKDNRDQGEKNYRNYQGYEEKFSKNRGSNNYRDHRENFKYHGNYEYNDHEEEEVDDDNQWQQKLKEADDFINNEFQQKDYSKKTEFKRNFKGVSSYSNNPDDNKNCEYNNIVGNKAFTPKYNNYNPNFFNKKPNYYNNYKKDSAYYGNDH